MEKSAHACECCERLPCKIFNTHTRTHFTYQTHKRLMANCFRCTPRRDVHQSHAHSGNHREDRPWCYQCKDLDMAKPTRRHHRKKKQEKRFAILQEKKSFIHNLLFFLSKKKKKKKDERKKSGFDKHVWIRKKFCLIQNVLKNLDNTKAHVSDFEKATCTTQLMNEKKTPTKWETL